MKTILKSSFAALAVFAAVSSANAGSISFNNHANWPPSKMVATVNTYNIDWDANQIFMNANGKFKVSACTNAQTDSINFYVRRINLAKPSSKDAEASACIRGVLVQARIDAAKSSDRTLLSNLDAVEASLPK